MNDFLNSILEDNRTLILLSLAAVMANVYLLFGIKGLFSKSYVIKLHYRKFITYISAGTSMLVMLITITSYMFMWPLNLNPKQKPIITLNDSNFHISESDTTGTIIGTIKAADPDDDELTFRIISGNDLDAFRIDENTSELTVANSEILDFETKPTFELEIEVSDGELSATSIISINIMDVDDQVLGMEDNLKRSIKIYPNPTQDYLNIEWDNFENATVSELSGNELIRSDSQILDLRGLPPGAYLITLHGTNNEEQTYRIIKE